MSETQNTQPQVTIGSKTPQEAKIPVDTEFIVPTDTVELPSKGAFYAGNKTSVTVKYLTAEEDDILFSTELIKNNQVLNVLLENSIKDKDINPDDMLSGDRNYILIHLRRISFGPEYKPGLKIECAGCGETYEPEIDLDKLQPKMLESMPDAQGEFTVQLPMTKATIKFRPLRGSDEKLLAKKIEQGQKKGSVKVSNLITQRYLMQIMEVDGKRDKLYIQKFIKFMPTKDSIFFRIYTRNIEPGINLDYEFECPSCGHLENHDVPVTSKLFYPDTEELTK